MSTSAKAPPVASTSKGKQHVRQGDVLARKEALVEELANAFKEHAKPVQAELASERAAIRLAPPEHFRTEFVYSLIGFALLCLFMLKTAHTPTP